VSLVFGLWSWVFVTIHDRKTKTKNQRPKTKAPMSWLNQIDAGKILLFTLILSRVSGLMMAAPMYGALEVPVQVRALLAFALSLLILPTQWHLTVHDPGAVLVYLVLVGTELVVGLWLGLGMQILFAGIQMSGQLISRVSGETLSEVFDPNMAENLPMLSQMLYMLSLAVFLGMGGHRLLMAGLLDTFQTVPPGSAGLPDTVRETFDLLVTQSFTLAIQAAAPVLTAILIATLVIGLIGRTLPQLNVMVLGFGLNAMVMYAVLMVSLGGAVWVFQDQVEPMLETLLRATQDARHTPWLAGT
jgi:flagellar biosynthesis protein FliR